MSLVLLQICLPWIISIWSLSIVTTEESRNCGYNNKCGYHNLTGTNVADKNTGKHEYPMVAWVKDLRSEDCFKCPAVIISKFYVLVTAYCLLKNEGMLKIELSKNYPQIYVDPKDIGVVVGDWLLNTIQENSFETKTYTAELIEINHNFDMRVLSLTQQFDIGLIKTVKPIQFGYYASPVCLPFGGGKRGRSFEGSAIALGWNYNDLGNLRIPGGILQKSRVKVLSNSDCKTTVDNTDNRLCIEFSEDENSLICRGWSGGPVLQANEVGNLEIIGFLMSAINGCDIQPLHNTIVRVHSHLEFLLENTTDEHFCGREKFPDL